MIIYFSKLLIYNNLENTFLNISKYDKKIFKKIIFYKLLYFNNLEKYKNFFNFFIYKLINFVII